MAIILGLDIAVILYMCKIKKNFMHPVIYFYGMFCLPLLFSILNLYHSKIENSGLVIWVLFLGLIGFAVGTLPIKLVLKIKSNPLKVSYSEEELDYRKEIIYVVIGISFAFNLFMAITTISFLGRGYAYSSIRDLLYGYSGVEETFFKNTFLATFNSWISTPCCYLVASLAVIEIFERKFSIEMRIFMILNIALYIFASGGRLIVLTILVQSFFLFQYYKIDVPPKTKRKIIKIGIMLVVALAVITVYRTKTTDQVTTEVNTVYAYFNIPIPLLSEWIERTKTSNIYGYGFAFLNGFMEAISYVLTKVGITLKLYQSVVEQISLPQTKWIQVYDGHWYNAFCTLFYYFYVDFRLPGVFIESLLFGSFTKKYYRKVCILEDKSYLPAYLTILQVITMVFIRWQFGTLSHVITMTLALLCVKREKA